MTVTLCSARGKALGDPAMSGPTMGHLLRHIRDTNTVPALHALSQSIANDDPTDEATPRLTAVIVTKLARLVGAN